MTERNTVQKALIYETLCRLANHPTADEVYAEVHKNSPSISRATVYRVLNQFSENGRVLRFGVYGGADHYDHNTHRHYHVQCTRCGRVSDVEMPYMDGLEEKAQSGSGYSVTGYTIEFSGVCPECMTERDNMVHTSMG